MPVRRSIQDTPPEEPGLSRAVWIATICSALMISQQVANKAARDALFLSHFAIDQLPPMLISAAVFSIIIVYFASKAMIRWSPGILTPALFLLSALFVTIEFGIAGQSPKLAAVLLYLHVASIGSILISGFWSVVNERFDPRTAKRRIGRIAGGATLGGLLGGILAERMAATLGVLPTLPVLALIQIVCAVLLLAMRPKGAPYANPAAGAEAGSRGGEPDRKSESGLRILMRVAYIRNLGLLVLLGNVAATLIDYVFKAQAAATLTDGNDLMRFFAVFYTLVSLVTFAVQTGFTRRFLERVDPSRSVAAAVAIRPGFVILGALTVIPFLSLTTAAVFRGFEAVLQSSLFRSGYELLFAPIIPEKKRATKPIVDVGFDRMGDAIGGGIVRLLLFLPVGISHPVMLLGAALVSVAAGFVATTMNRGRAVALEKSLLNQKGALDNAGPDGFRSDPSIMQTLSGIDLSGVDLSLTMNTGSIADIARAEDGGESPPKTEARDAGLAPASGERQPEAPRGPDIRDPLIAAIIELRSGNAKRIRTYLRTNRPINPHLAAHVIPLLAWDEASVGASRALAEIAADISGQLVDRLLDAKEEFAIRRRIPRLLTGSPHEHAVQGLLAALRDKRFEVRFQSGRALVRMKQKHPELKIDRRRVFETVIAEAKVDRRVWESQRLLDKPSDGDEDSPIVDKVLRERTNRSMEHVFTILSLVLPREPLRIAFRGLYTNDRHLRGTALEYLESVLPEDVRQILWPFLEGETPKDAAPKSRDEIMKELLESNQSIEINLNELRRRHGKE